MREPLFLGIDVGTSGTKALMIDARGRVCGEAAAEHALLTPRAGWSEQRPADWWKSTCRATAAALRAALDPRGERVAAVGLSGQMHGSVFLDARQRVLCNALLWNDQRTQRECREIEQRAGGRAALIRQTRNVALTGYTAPKILWLRRHRPRLFRQVRSVILPKDYVRLRLTATLGCDMSDASGTLLFDVARRRWATGLIERLGLDPAWFPPADESSTVIGEISRAAAAATGLRAGTPVVAGAGDQPAAAVGAGVVRAGIVSATIGTSGVVFAHSDSPVENRAGLLQSFCHAAPGAWCAFGCMLSAGGALQWARQVLYADRLAQARTAAERDRLYAVMIDDAARAGDDAAAPLFHPYLTGERCPYAHPHARAGWIGLTRRHTRGDLVRAVLIGITLGMARQIALLRARGIRIREVRLAGGGARSAWWRQLQADAYGAHCATLRSEQGSALGAAILATVGAGEFASVAAACERLCATTSVVTPRAARTRTLRRSMNRAAATYEALAPFYEDGW